MSTEDEQQPPTPLTPVAAWRQTAERKSGAIGAAAARARRMDWRTPDDACMIETAPPKLPEPPGEALKHLPETSLPVVYPLGHAEGQMRWVYVKRCEMPGCHNRAQTRWFGSPARGEVHVYDKFCRAHERGGYLATLRTIDYTTPSGRETYNELGALVEELEEELEQEGTDL